MIALSAEVITNMMLYNKFKEHIKNMAITKEVKQEIVKEFGNDPKNTGSTEVQVAILTKEIESLTQHLKNNQKDFASKRILYAKNSKRRSLLNYLKNTDIEKYRALVKKLNIRAAN